ncbi:RING finger protein 26 [Cricetulus griseus]|uniref:RING finger protein 26 n=1 Tax=Cricetulus griseus TaxID=10029 RepID=G3I4F9_CRIGR|nr:RING finger protein 26 [Cricetulus griseus]
MEAVFLVVNRVGLVLNLLTFVLDLNFLLLSSLLTTLAWLLAFIYNLPHTACDICAIAMSLVTYVINSLVNICLIDT